MSKINSGNERLLEPIGLTDGQERIYRSLLQSGASSVKSIAETAGLSQQETRRLLELLRSKGLVTRAPGKSVRFLAVDPEVALEDLMAKQQDELDRIRNVSQQLAEEYKANLLVASSANLLEVLDSEELIGRRALQLLRSARREYLAFDKPPYANASEVNDRVVESALRRGLKIRVVYDSEALAYEGGMDAIRRFRALGEDSRVFPHVPFKVNIADRRKALIPLATEDTGRVDGALLVQSSHLVDALVVLWELIWERSFPLVDSQELERVEPTTPIRESDSELIDLLLAGAKSAAIARQLRVSTTTVERRIKRLMTALGASTRFQAGFRLASMIERIRTTVRPSVKSEFGSEARSGPQGDDH